MRSIAILSALAFGYYMFRSSGSSAKSKHDATSSSRSVDTSDHALA